MGRYYQITQDDVRTLSKLIRHHGNARLVKRALAIRSLAAGLPVAEAAARHDMSRGVLHVWIRAFKTNPDAEAALSDQKRHFKRRKRSAARDRIAALMTQSPRDFGYRHQDWVTELLQAQLGKEGIEVSLDTIRRAMKELGYRWKRPRFVLSRQSPTWRQAKGGSSAAS